jgi:acetyl esterase/lipase
MKRQSFLFLFTTLFFLSGISIQAQEYRTVLNLPYYPESRMAANNYLKERCRLDLYLPAAKKGFSTIVWFHGGGLTGGEKEFPYQLKEQGFGVIGVGYRLDPKVHSPAYIEDAAAAVAWVFKHIGEYGGDTNLIFVSGHSAGGYLALMLGLDKKWLTTNKVDANKIAGLIPMSGQAITHIAIRKERGIPQNQPVIDQLAPLYHVRADATPLLLITGDRELEMLGRYEENAYLARMMKVSGHKSTQLFELDGYEHGMIEGGMPLLIEFVRKREKEILASK